MPTPKVYWLTGLSGAGKTTIAEHLYGVLRQYFPKVCLLDGDVMRRGLCKDLGFDTDSRLENMRRIGEVAKLMYIMGIPVVAAFISPHKAGRALVRSLFPEGSFVEIYVATPLQECEQRDVKGLYKKARAGHIENFTGISAPYEAPEHPEVTVNTVGVDVNHCVAHIMNTQFFAAHKSMDAVVGSQALVGDGRKG